MTALLKECLGPVTRFYLILHIFVGVPCDGLAEGVSGSSQESSRHARQDQLINTPLIRFFELIDRLFIFII